MKIKELKLYTIKLKEEFDFYANTLGFEVIKHTDDLFTIRIGWSLLTFQKSDKEHKYHYCFLIPSNKLLEALNWMEKRVEIIDIDNGQKTVNFEGWNADSFYFYDASGNIAEFIVRYDLNNEVHDDFDILKVLCLNEIGLPSDDIVKVNNQLKFEIGIDTWKGDTERFGTIGDQEGIFLIPNYKIKDIWFPTNIKIRPEPFECVVENNGNKYFVEFKNEEIKISTYYVH